MSAASDIVDKGTVPEEWNPQELVDTVKAGYAELDSLGENPQIPAVRFARDDVGEVIHDANGNPELIALVDENNNPVLESHPLHARAEKDGLLAYRYEVAGEDGSVVAIYAKNRSPVAKMVAFDSIEEASAWSPREV